MMHVKLFSSACKHRCYYLNLGSVSSHRTFGALPLIADSHTSSKGPWLCPYLVVTFCQQGHSEKLQMVTTQEECPNQVCVSVWSVSVCVHVCLLAREGFM